MRLIKYFLLGLALTPYLAQAGPDYQYTYRFTNRTGEPTDAITIYSGAAPTVAINNKLNACTGWQLSYNAEGFSALSITLQSAPNSITTTGTTPGAWSTFSGTNVSGTLAMTSTAQGLYIGYAYFPYIRVNLTSVTGTGSVDVQLSCWKSIAYVAGLSSSGGSPAGNNGDFQIKNSTALAAGTCNDNGTDITCTGIVKATGGVQTGSGSTPGLDQDFCGTAPGNATSGYVNGYCTSKIPKFKNEDGTVFEPVIGIADPADSSYVSYIGTDGVAHRTTPSGGSAPYSSYTPATTAISMTGSNVNIYSIASVPALAADKCYLINVGALTAVGATNLFIFVDSTQVAQPWSAASGAYTFTSFLYCNNAATQAAQSAHILNEYYIVAASLPTNGAIATVGNNLATPITPTAVDWSSSHTISFKANAASGTVTGALFQIVLQ